MIVTLITFIALTLLIAAGISDWSETSKRDRIAFLKLIGKSVICSAIAIIILSVIVTLF